MSSRGPRITSDLFEKQLRQAGGSRWDPWFGTSEGPSSLRQQYGGQVVPRQLHLVLEDERLRGMTATERRDALKALARLLLEASGMTMQEGSDDNA
jgi:hypothetical protein